MTRVSLAGVFAAAALAAGCSRPAQSAADTATASSTAASAATPQVDTVSTTTQVTTSSSTVTRKPSGKKLSSGKKSSGDVTHRAGANNSVRSTDPTPNDSILGRDSVIRFPIRRLPTASSSPVKR
jgi:hypothetical protein